MDKDFRPELLDEILQGAKTQEAIFGPTGVIRQLTAAIVQRALSAELGYHLDQERQRDADTANRRNGASSKRVQTESGPVEIRVPRDRNSTFEPQVLPKHSRRLAGFDDKVIALYARGMSVRDIQQHLEELYGTEVSAELISRVTDAVWDEIKIWQSRPIDSCYAVVWLDALFVKMRDQGAVHNKAVYTAIGLRMDGRKEVLGLWVDGTEGSKFWMRVLSELRARGLRDVLVCCCDGLKGFAQAIEAVFPNAVVQTCIVHQVRHCLSFVGWKERKQVAAAMKPIYGAESEQAAARALDAFEQAWGKQYPMIVSSWRARWNELTPFLAFPPEVRRMIYTTNTIESLNYQLRKTIRTKGHFPDQDSALKLLFLCLRNIEKKWQMPIPYWNRVLSQLIAYFGEQRTLAGVDGHGAQNS